MNPRGGMYMDAILIGVALVSFAAFQLFMYKTYKRLEEWPYGKKKKP